MLQADRLALLLSLSFIVLSSSVSAQEALGERPRVILGVEDAVRLATTHNTSLRVSYYGHLIERTRIAEAEGAFEPVGFLGANYGTNEVTFPQIFPSGQFDAMGNPIFQQVVVTDSSVNANWNAGVRGLAPTGATWEARVSTDYRDREAGGLVDPSYTTTTSLSLSQPILRGAWLQYNQAATQQARFSENQSRQRFRADVVDTIFAVHEAYWDHVFSIQDLAVKRRSLEVAQRLLAINRIKVETGVFAPIEIVSAESGVASRVTDVIVAENQISETEDTLKRLVLPFRDLAEWNTEIVAKDGIDESVWSVPGLEECIEVAMSERPDLVEARVLLRSRELSVSVADNETLPKLDLNTSANFTGLQGTFGPSFADAYGETGAQSWDVGVSLEVPLGNKSARSRLARSRLERDQSLMSYRNTQLSAVEAVRRAWRDVQISEKTIGSRRKAAELKQEELKNEQIKLESKVSTNFQVLQVEEDLALRQSELIRSLVDYRKALARLAQAMGTSLDVAKWAKR
ncbi:MAG: TolC family protein [Planctomycetes bacterium]|nr:TolC family protein [Planctomycetota bacterium]